MSIKQQVADHEAKEKRLKHRSDEDNTNLSFDDDKDDLQDKISQIPELTRQKELLEMHLNTAFALFDIITARGIDEYVKLEESIITGGGSTSNASKRKDEVLQLLSGEKGNTQDKLRLFLIFFSAYHQHLTDVFLNDI